MKILIIIVLAYLLLKKKKSAPPKTSAEPKEPTMKNVVGRIVTFGSFLNSIIERVLLFWARASMEFSVARTSKEKELEVRQAFDSWGKMRKDYDAWIEKSEEENENFSANDAIDEFEKYSWVYYNNGLSYSEGIGVMTVLTFIVTAITTAVFLVVF